MKVCQYFAINLVGRAVWVQEGSPLLPQLPRVMTLEKNYICSADPLLWCIVSSENGQMLGCKNKDLASKQAAGYV